MLKLLLFILISTTVSTLVKCDGFHLQDVDLPLGKLVRKYGYPFEEHEIVTTDGYILTTHRIPHGKLSRKPNQKPVLFIHGMGGVSENYFNLGPGRALGFLLAERGYDVWAMNTRGNFFSRRHTSLDPNESRFWDFSLDEIISIDSRMNIDYILNVTNKKQVALIGYSQGSIVNFAITCCLPGYNEKISMHIHLAPSFFHSFNTEFFTNMAAKYYPELEATARVFRVFEMCPPNLLESMKLLTKWLGIDELLRINQIVYGTKSDLIKNESVPFVLRSTPSGISLRQFIHILQVVKNVDFRKYDFGKKENLRRYNKEVPPFYDIRKSTSPAILVLGQKDWLSPVEHTKFLVKHLGNVAEVLLVKNEEFSHFDFIAAHNAKELIYDELMDMMDKIPYK